MSGQADAGSFRDPRGSVYVTQDRVFRTVMPVGIEDYEFVRSTGLFDDLVEAGLPEPIIFAVSSKLRVSEEVLDDDLPGSLYVYKGTMWPKQVLELLERGRAG